MSSVVLIWIVISILLLPFALAALPARVLGRTAAILGAASMLVFTGLSAAGIFGPASDPSYPGESNWEAKDSHGFFVGILGIELALAVTFVVLAVQRGPSTRIRATAWCRGAAVVAIGYLLILALSN
jgi:hypothetical protein